MRRFKNRACPDCKGEAAGALRPGVFKAFSSGYAEDAGPVLVGATACFGERVTFKSKCDYQWLSEVGSSYSKMIRLLITQALAASTAGSMNHSVPSPNA